MCEKCDRIAMNRGTIIEIETFNAIWQNALALKIAVHHFKEELLRLDADDHYPEFDEVMDEFIKVMDAMEKHSLLSAKELAERL